MFVEILDPLCKEFVKQCSVLGLKVLLVKSQDDKDSTLFEVMEAADVMTYYSLGAWVGYQTREYYKTIDDPK